MNDLDAHLSEPGSRAPMLSLPEQIAEQIGKDIIAGRFEPGARIQEVEVANSFQVSRGPVREALRILERDGLVQISARRGAQVTELTIEEVNAIFDPRIALHGLAARRMAERRDPAALARMRTCVERLGAAATANDHAAYVEASYRTTRAMCEGSGNPFLIRLVFLLSNQTLRYAALGLSTAKRREQSLKGWRRMLRAMERGEAEEAQAVAEQLGRESREMAVRLLREAQVART